MYFALFKSLLVGYASKYPYLNVINHLLDFVIRRLMKDTVPDGVDLADYLKENNQRLFDGNQRLIRNLHDTAAVGLQWINYGENMGKRGIVTGFDVSFWQAALLGLLIRQLRTQIVYLQTDTSPNAPQLQKLLIEALAILMRYQESMYERDTPYYKVVTNTAAISVLGAIIQHETRLIAVRQTDGFEEFRLQYTQRAGYLAASWDTLPSDELPKHVNALIDELSGETTRLLQNLQQSDALNASVSTALSFGMDENTTVDEAAKAVLTTENGKMLADSILHTPKPTA